MWAQTSLSLLLPWSIPILSYRLRRAKVREDGDLKDKTLRDYLAQSLIH